MNLREQLHVRIDRLGEQDREEVIKILDNIEKKALNDVLSQAGIGLPKTSDYISVPLLIGMGKTASEQLIEDRK